MDTGTKAKTLEEFELEEAEGNKKKGKAKAPKAPKVPKAPKEKKAKKEKKRGKGANADDNIAAMEAVSDEPVREKRRHPVRNTLIFTSLFWLMLIGAVVAVCALGYTDNFGDYHYLLDPEGYIRGPVLTFLNPEDGDREQYYAAEFEYINDLTAEREELKAEYEQKLEELDLLEEELSDWEALLDERESDLDDRMPDYGDEGNSMPVTADIASLAKAWGEMTPANAAAAIEEMDDDEVTLSVLRHVKYKNLAKILDAMSAEEAARISKMLVTLNE